MKDWKKALVVWEPSKPTPAQLAEVMDRAERKFRINFQETIRDQIVVSRKSKSILLRRKSKLVLLKNKEG